MSKVTATKQPVISLKKVKMFKGHDGVGLDCDLYVDGKKIAHVFDSAHGGGNEYQPYGKDMEELKVNRKILTDLEEYAKTLPEKQYPADLGGGNYQPDLDSLVNDELMKLEKEKLAAKLLKKFSTHIIIGVPGGDSYRELAYGKPAIPLASIPREKLQADIRNIRLEAGERILNTNLGALGIQL